MKTLYWLDKNLEKYICCVLLSAMTVIIVAQLILRWTGLPLAWTEEIARYCFVWLIYIACAYGVRLRKHIKVDAVMLLFKEKGQFRLKVVSNVLFLAFCIIITYYGVILVSKIHFVQHQVSPAVQLPMAIPYSSFVVGCILMSIRLVQDTVLLIKEHRDAVSTAASAGNEVTE
jgi:TRAP-type C4-dicarboxylate transport system permease small subunit